MTVFSKEKPYPHPLSYRVRVTYDDQHGHSYGPEEYILDFRVFEGQAVGPKGMPELISAVENMLNEHRKWTDGARGLQVNAWNARQESRRRDRPFRVRRARRAYAEGGWRGGLRYWLDLWQRRYGLWSR